MFEDFFYQTHQGEIFSKTRCMQHERIVTDFFRSCLCNLGYETTDPAQRVWKRGDKTVIVCLADDFNVCGARLELNPAQWFDNQTVVVTDNHITVPTQYQICQLPVSYFGIFGYVPGDQIYMPERRFNFSINRIDTQRELVLLELLQQSAGIQQVLEDDFINFNGWDADGANSTHDDVRHNFYKYWGQIKSFYGDRYQHHVDQLINCLPIRNHQLSIEQATMKSWLTPVIETYSGNTTMAFSEKIFRALQTPVPWTLYSTTGAVQYLQSLGFDILDDLVDHSYNTFAQDTPHGIDKISLFVSDSIQNVKKLQQMNFLQLQSRCTRAATHNQQQLARLKSQWPTDFAQWLPCVIDKII
jgi:hypothetical protein